MKQQYGWYQKLKLANKKKGYAAPLKRIFTVNLGDFYAILSSLFWNSIWITVMFNSVYFLAWKLHTKDGCYVLMTFDFFIKNKHPAYILNK